MDANYLFIYPPAPEELKERIVKKGLEDEDEVKQKLEAGLKEIEYANKTILFKYKIINEEIAASYVEFKELLLRVYKQEVQIIQSQDSLAK
jgi:guanylate kinase